MGVGWCFSWLATGQMTSLPGLSAALLSDWKKDFSPDHLEQIRFICLVMSRDYITGHFSDIKKYACAIEHRLDDSDCTVETLLEDNLRCLDGCQRYNCRYILIDGEYRVDPVF